MGRHGGLDAALALQRGVTVRTTAHAVKSLTNGQRCTSITSQMTEHTVRSKLHASERRDAMESGRQTAHAGGGEFSQSAKHEVIENQ
jgi:hypothetical protein